MLQKFQAFFRRVVEHVENREVPFAKHVVLFLSILAVRLALEFWSSRKLFTLDDVLHIGLWFTCIVMMFMLLLHLFSGEKMVRIARLVITFFSVALIAPILDLLLSGGQGFKMNYMSLQPGPNFVGDVVFAFFTLGGSSLERGATPGIRIEIALLVLASFNYIRTKRSSIWLGALGALAIYTALFMSGAIPLLLTSVNRWFHLSFGPEDRSTVMLLATLDAALLLALVKLHLGRLVRPSLAAMSLGQVIACASLVWLGFRLGRELYPENWLLDPTTLYHFPIAALVIWGAGFSYGVGRSLADNRTALYVWLLVLPLTALVSFRLCFSSAVVLALLQMHSHAPMNLSRAPLLGSLVQACLALAFAFAGFTLANAPMIGFPTHLMWPMLAIAFSLSLAGEEDANREFVVNWVPSWIVGHRQIFRVVIASFLALSWVAWIANVDTSSRLKIVFGLLALIQFMLLLFGRRGSLALWWTVALGCMVFAKGMAS